MLKSNDKFMNVVLILQTAVAARWTSAIQIKTCAAAVAGILNVVLILQTALAAAVWTSTDNW